MVPLHLSIGGHDKVSIISCVAHLGMETKMIERSTPS